MRLKFLAALAGLFAASAMTATAQPPAKAQHKPIVVPAPNVAGGKVVLVPRDQLRAGPSIKTARLHPETRKAMATKALVVPAEWDWTKKGTIVLPMLGNNAYGDCYYAAPCHVVQLMTGMNGSPTVFDLQSVINRYLRLSGGDNGLSDSDVFPEFKAGIVGPNGPHKILDVLVIPSTDTAACDLTSYAFGPQMFTFTVYSNFMNVTAGKVLDGNTGGVQGGHAVVFSGKKNATLNGQTVSTRQLETWAIQPSVLVTQRWINGVEPETIAVFSKEWFNKDGYAPNGQHYTTLVTLWNSIGGHVTDLTGGFPSPTPIPPVPPIPVPPTPTPTPTTTVYRGPDQRVGFDVYNPTTGEIVGKSFIEKNSFVLHPFTTGQPSSLSLDVIFALFALDRDIRASGNGTLDADFKAMMAAVKARKNVLPAVEKFAFDLIAAGTDPAVLADLRRLMADLGIPIPFGSVLHTFPSAKPSAPDALPRTFPKGVPVGPGAALPRGVVPELALAY